MSDLLESRHASALIGRDVELRRVADLLSLAGERGLVVRGEAGIGKSALLRWSRRAAGDRGMRVLTATGLEPEMTLPFSGLHQLLLPILADVDALPHPQRDAVHAAFGVEERAAPEPFLIALGVLHLLDDAAGGAPLLLAVDDVQWLDHETAEVLAFVARRLDSGPIVLLAAMREGEASALDAIGLSELRLEPLAAEPASALVRIRAPELPKAVRDQLLEEAGGNPLALVELPVGAVGLDPGAPPPAWLPLTTRLEQAFASRVSDLPALTRALLVVAAINDSASVGETLAAARRMLGVDVVLHDFAPAVVDRLVELEVATLRFRHPLIRSAIYQGATACERRGAHLAVADVLGDDADRSIWHRAEASAGPDDEVAHGLEAAAKRARHRGAIPTALAGLERAARLSVDPGDRTRRLLAAAGSAHELGQGATIVRLLAELEGSALTAHDRVQISLLRAAYEGSEALSTAGVLARIDAAERAIASDDIDVAFELLIYAAGVSWLLGTPWADGRRQLVATLDTAPHDPSDPRALLVLAMGATVERGRDVVDRLRRSEAAPEDATAVYLLGWAASAVGAFDAAIPLLHRAVGGLRSEGRLGPLCRALGVLARVSFTRGDFRTALVAADESARLAVEAGQPHEVIHAETTKALVDAVGGRFARAEAMATELERGALALGLSVRLAEAQHLRGLVALGSGRPGDAYEQLRRIFVPGDPAHHPYIETRAIADLVEAAAHAGTQHELGSLYEHLERVAAATRSPALRAALAFARPLLATDEHAEALFIVALDDLADWPLLRARALLAHGQWLRRQRRAAESRIPLRTAAQALDALDAVWWRDRARRELRASGDTEGHRDGLQQHELTPQELQIARMAADGRSNREIAQDLFISRRTVSTHLYKIFPKLGITARTELDAALEASTLPRP